MDDGSGSGEEERGAVGVGRDDGRERQRGSVVLCCRHRHVKRRRRMGKRRGEVEAVGGEVRRRVGAELRHGHDGRRLDEVWEGWKRRDWGKEAALARASWLAL